MGPPILAADAFACGSCFGRLSTYFVNTTLGSSVPKSRQHEPTCASATPPYGTAAVGAADVPMLFVSVTVNDVTACWFPVTVNGCVSVNWLP